ncbi:MAG: histidine ammonia-lyase, partial [Pirellulaceae bacterium]
AEVRCTETAGDGNGATLGSDCLEPSTVWETALLANAPGSRLRIRLTASARKRIFQATAFLDKLVAAEEPIYGINTGFGYFADVQIPPEKLVELQYNIIRSHCSNVGEALDRDITLASWLVNLNKFCQGNSGVRLELIETIIKSLEAGILAVIPSRGSVGASGDLSSSAHAARALLGEGLCTYPQNGDFVTVPAAEALAACGVAPITLGPKEGLSLVNGTALTTALAVKAWYVGRRLLRIANAAAAMTIEALGGARWICAQRTVRAHRHRGTIQCGAEIAGWLGKRSEMAYRHVDKQWIQDPYSMRCAPQVHGAVWEEIDASESILRNEINAATDNPLLFPEEMCVSNTGNFHAIYPARVSDRLASALATLASISERRINQAMCAKRKHLPTFLVQNGGLNSGFMMAHVTAAALVSEAKSLSMPASVDSIPTNIEQEDHVSMGPIAGFKAIRILDNLRGVLSIELLCAAQAFDLLAPAKPSPALAELHAEIRKLVPPLEQDRSLSEDIEAISLAIQQGSFMCRQVRSA